jgi:hypothetical protein
MIGMNIETKSSRCPTGYACRECAEIAIGFRAHRVVPSDWIGPAPGARSQNDLAKEWISHRQTGPLVANRSAALDTEPATGELSADQPPLHAAA